MAKKGQTFSDVVAITNNGSADAESAASTLSVSPGAVITEITVQDLTVGHTYAVKIDCPNLGAPQKYLVPAAGAPATNGGALVPAVERIPVRIALPPGTSQIKVSTFADTASATVEVGIKWEMGSSEQQTYGDFLTASVGTAEALAGSISIAGGVTIKKIVVSSRLSIGLVKNVRIDFAGVETPQKYSTTPMIYDAVGTQVQNNGINGALSIEVNIPIPANVNTINIYAVSQTASNTSAIGLVWVN